MHYLPLDIQLEFFKLYNNEIPVSDLETWIYSKKEHEEFLDQETYLDLISLNYKTRHIKHELGKIINHHLDFGILEERKLRKILDDLIDRTGQFT